MKLGSISAYNRLCWIPEEEVSHGGKWAFSPNSVKLAEYFFFGEATVPAFYCISCSKIIIDLNKLNASKTI